MVKVLTGLVAGIVITVAAVFFMMPRLMFKETVSPYGMEETIARIQHNILKNPNGWTLVGLRNPAKAIEQDGGNVLPVQMIETCSTRYSKPILKDDSVRFLSILMPCKISVYKKNDGKVYIATMNAGVMGKLFGPLVGEIMSQVAADQKTFLEFDPNMPAPEIIKPAAPSGAGGAGGAGGGC